MVLAVAGVEITQVLILLMIGSIAGVLGGLLGIGGGLVMIPAMVLAFTDQVYGPNSFHLFKLAALATAVVLSLPAVRQHARAGAIVRPMVIAIIPLGLSGVAVGVGVARLLLADEHTEILRRAFGGFMLLVVAVNIWYRRHARRYGPDRCPNSSRWALIGAVVGFPSGVISGLLGVGGGVWAVPVQNFAFGLRLPNAIANSACMIVAVAAGASVAQSLAIVHLHDPLVPVWKGYVMAACLAPGAVVGGSLGAKLTHRLPVAWLRRAFYVLLAVTGLRLLLY